MPRISITIIPNQYPESPHYQLKQVKIDPTNLMHGKGTPSYKLIKTLKTENTKKPTVQVSAEPAVNQFLSGTPTAAPQKQASTGLFKRLVAKMFGSENQPTKPAEKTTAKHRPAQQTRRRSPGEGHQRGRSPQHAQRKSTGRSSSGDHKKRDDDNQSPSRGGRSRRGTRGGQRHSGQRREGQQRDDQQPSGQQRDDQQRGGQQRGGQRRSTGQRRGSEQRSGGDSTPPSGNKMAAHDTPGIHSSLNPGYDPAPTYQPINTTSYSEFDTPRSDDNQKNGNIAADTSSTKKENKEMPNKGDKETSD